MISDEDFNALKSMSPTRTSVWASGQRIGQLEKLHEQTSKRTNRQQTIQQLEQRWANANAGTTQRRKRRAAKFSRFIRFPARDERVAQFTMAVTPEFNLAGRRGSTHFAWVIAPIFCSATTTSCSKLG